MTQLSSVLRVVPRNLASLLFGKLAFLPLPSFLLLPILRRYCEHYGAKPEEASRDLSDYRSLGDFFIRDLAPGARTIEDEIVSPVDAVLTQHGRIARGELLQVKGKTYPLAGLVADSELEEYFQDGYYITLYLAPGDYHHVHSPVDGVITDSYHLPGDLWPVNSWSTENIDNLFCKNERLITLLETERGRVGVIKVGAYNVGSIQPAYDTFRTNSLERIIRFGSVICRRSYSPAIRMKRGERLATFRMGSTVVLLFAAGTFTPGAKCRLGPIQLGARLSAVPEGVSS